jgi:hypothetical protein
MQRHRIAIASAPSLAALRIALFCVSAQPTASRQQEQAKFALDAGIRYGCIQYTELSYLIRQILISRISTAASKEVQAVLFEPRNCSSACNN